ncbi:hypothetical protein FF011L_42440 [Roseimaritima multifibrata]|uniref:Uncharacterized protein n=1 Tax=Roseimaritima multifibrata TaxID=1930274 RepID=A0A517MKP2_9BACT|nr:hypothetical protein FF011L_42440 [Roseimaritima multifibrata]
MAAACFRRGKPNASYFLSGTARAVRQSRREYNEFAGRLALTGKKTRPQMQM